VLGLYQARQSNARLFMVPSMYHCSRGPGPNFFDALATLEQWVERGRAPDQWSRRSTRTMIRRSRRYGRPAAKTKTC
jgi:Tannase and feruloyl esterase